MNTDRRGREHGQIVGEKEERRPYKTEKQKERVWRGKDKKRESHKWGMARETGEKVTVVIDAQRGNRKNMIPD